MFENLMPDSIDSTGEVQKYHDSDSFSVYLTNDLLRNKLLYYW